MQGLASPFPLASTLLSPAVQVPSLGWNLDCRCASARAASPVQPQCSGWKHLLFSSAFASDTAPLNCGNRGVHCLPQWLTAWRPLSPRLPAKQDLSPCLGLLGVDSFSWFMFLRTLGFSWRWLRHEPHEGAVASGRGMRQIRKGLYLP